MHTLPTLHFDDVNTILRKDEALLISKHQAHALSAQGDAWAKLLRVDVPPQKIITPLLVTFS